MTDAYDAAYDLAEQTLREIGDGRDHAWSTACECDGCTAYGVAEKMRLARIDREQRRHIRKLRRGRTV